jgi:hypothetical protein
MNIRLLGVFILALVLLSFQTIVFAQQSQSSPAEAFKLFFEKVYLHLDRSYYATGDDIWFKAYLVNAQSNAPINTSNNLYVELIDPSATIISRKVIRIDSAIGVGDFQLGDSIAAGTYRIRAYTNWMRNFGSHFVFEKEIQVTNIAEVNRNTYAAAKPPTSNKKVVSTAAAYKIQFLPESGSMVEDVPTIVAFKAEDANGHGVEASGMIVSEKGDTVARFKTSYLGMGSFAFSPKAGNSYKAFVQYKNNSFISATFPSALPNGYVMNVTSVDTSGFVVNISSNNATSQLHPTGVVNITARHAGKSYFKQQVTLKDGKATITIPANDFPAGIAYITLYDENNRPNCERLVYVEKANPLHVSLTTNKPAYKSKEQATVEVSVTDANNQPVKTSLSLAAVDESMDAPSSGNIETHLMLESDLQGKVENAWAYFEKNNSNRLQQLDLLLRTQGWRSFLWRQIADTSIRISYLPEPGISISGTVTKPFTNKPMEGMNITLFAPGAKGDKIYLTKTNANGKYYLDGLPLYGIQTVRLNVGDGIGKKPGAIKMDTMYSNPLPVASKPSYTIDTTATSYFAHEAAKRSSIFKNSQWYNILPRVTVTNKRTTDVLRDGSVITTFGYPEYDFNITAKDYTYQTLRDFIVQKVPGAMYDEELEGVEFLSNGKRVRPIIRVNKTEDVFGRLDYYSLSMEQVESVRVRHMVGSPSYTGNNGADNGDNGNGEATATLRPAGGIRDFFLINLVIKPGNADQQLSKMNVDVTGYYESRMFYAPNYAKDDSTREDKRITIHWEPFIKTNANGKALVTFYNADPKGKIKIDVQGITPNGVPIVAKTEYEVK